MSKSARRIVFPLLIIMLGAGLIWVMIAQPGKTTTQESPETAAQTEAAPSGTAGDDSHTRRTDTEEVPAEAVVAASEAEDEGGGEPSISAPDATISSFENLVARPPGDIVGAGEGAPPTLGSLNPDEAALQVTFSPLSAGIDSIVFNNIWQTAAAKHQADDYYSALSEHGGDAAALPADLMLPPDDQRYVLIETREIPVRQPDGTTAKAIVPFLAALEVRMNDQRVNLQGKVWSDVSMPDDALNRTVRLQSDIFNENDDRVASIVRSFTLVPENKYELLVSHEFINRTSQPIDVVWIQDGPGDMPKSETDYIDRRRFQIAHLLSKKRDNWQPIIITDNGHYLIERSSVAKDLESRDMKLWPDEDAIEDKLTLTWFASVDRYFAIAIHPPYDGTGQPPNSLEDVVASIKLQGHVENEKVERIFSEIWSPKISIPPQESGALQLSVYAGPKDRGILRKTEPYTSLRLGGLIVYQMSSCCAFCTFQWLANLLLGLLSFFRHFLVFDWGIAIILLVLVVRTLLHPITKRSQIGMARMGKLMSTLKPEMDKLQEKYKNQPDKLRVEMMQLYREHGVNPLSCLGFLTMFLQTPIWIALYAMLYFEFDLRHQPAFYGLFQIFGDWTFLSDLSEQDRFIPFAQAWRAPVIDVPVLGFNILPLLLGIVFFIQQKYMSPPPSPTMTKEQIQQQKIMKIMMVVMMPIFMYLMPSGLTLYILTSSSIGILESRYVRKHIDQLDLTRKNQPAGAAAKKKKKKKPRGPMARALADRMDRQKSKQQPQKRYKKRK